MSHGTRDDKLIKTVVVHDGSFPVRYYMFLFPDVEETKEDLSVSNTELSAVLEYWDKLKPQCIAKPEPYEERKKRPRRIRNVGTKEL